MLLLPSLSSTPSENGVRLPQQVALDLENSIMASIKGNLRFTEPCREGLRAASSSNFGLQNDYVFDWTILKYQQSQMAAPPNRALDHRNYGNLELDLGSRLQPCPWGCLA